ncbi:MAG: AAA family ATPase [Planctomycetota bacterium]
MIAPLSVLESDEMSVEAEIKKFRQWDEQLQTAIREQILGQDAAIEASLCTLLAGGHLLLVGVPGTGKTRLAECLSQGLGLPKGRIQFTPDLLPADILGAETLISGPQGDRVEFRKGPIFHPLIVADEINRGTPRTQSALLEAMQEGQVTLAGERYPLDPNFSVIATRNPIEMEGTYPPPGSTKRSIHDGSLAASSGSECSGQNRPIDDRFLRYGNPEWLRVGNLRGIAGNGAQSHRRRCHRRSSRTVGCSQPSGRPHGSAVDS